MSSRTRPTFARTIVTVAVFGAAFGCASASASASGQLEVTESHSIGRGYLEANGMLSGSFVRDDGSQATYEAPVQLLYPRDRARCSGVGVEDLANAAFYNFPNLQDDYWNIRFARWMLTDAFLVERRVSYGAATWDKKAVDRLGTGHIERREDGRRILDDVAGLLRDPSSVRITQAPAGFIAPRCKAEDLLAYGFSDSASLLRTYFLEGNKRGVFDGGLIHTAGATCWNFSVGQAVDSCPRLPEDLEGKVISLDAETDVQAQSGAQARQELASYRHYEIAGAAHLPKDEVDLMELAREADDENPAFALALRSTSRHQNPEGMGPATRAAFHHLVRWVRHGIRPPGNAYLEGSFDPLGSFTISRDSDGNALGGIRLPWLNTVLEDGTRVGAALGTHDGVDPLGGFILGGHYECFADIPARYPTHRGYRNLVAAGARYAETSGWILEQDRRAYAQQAARLDLGDVRCPPWPSGAGGAALSARSASAFFHERAL